MEFRGFPVKKTRRPGSSAQRRAVATEFESLRSIIREFDHQIRRAREEGNEEISQRIEYFLIPLKRRYLLLARTRAEMQGSPPCTACGSTATELNWRQSAARGDLTPMSHCIECGASAVIHAN